MKFLNYLPLLSLLLFSCSKDSKPNDIVLNELESGGFVRTLDFINSDLILNDMNSTFGVNLEIQDQENGGLMENVEVFVRFKDNNNDNGISTTTETLFRTLTPSEFQAGPTGLPRTTLNIAQSELITSTQIDGTAIRCSDQFILRMVLNLTDGRSFSVENGSSSVVIAFDTLYSSPYCYTLNIVEPISDNQFIGMYRYESIIDGPFGPTFGSSKIVKITRGSSKNTRSFETDYIVSRQNEPSRTFNFIVSCDEVLFRKNQISSFFSWCRPGGGFSFGGAPILLGPDTTNSTIDPGDDSTFELSFVEGYKGWDGDCEVGTVPVKILFTKQ